MRPVSQGTSRSAEACVARGARAHGGARRGRGATRAARLIGAIVAGGGSTRLGGVPKGLELVGGRRIVDRVATALRDVTDDLVLITNDSTLAERIPELRSIADVRPERGSLVGIHSALRAATDGALVVAWDMPFVTARLLHLIGTTLVPGVYAAIPEIDGRLEPLCAAYSSSCLPLLDAALDAGELRVSAFVDSLPVVRRIGVAELARLGDPARLFFNVNTPADLAEAERMARGD